jgi:hemerythrin
MNFKEQVILANKLHKQKQEREQFEDLIPCEVRFEDDFNSIFRDDEKFMPQIKIDQHHEHGVKPSDFC